jgi:hypothetical protein
MHQGLIFPGYVAIDLPQETCTPSKIFHCGMTAIENGAAD